MGLTRGFFESFEVKEKKERKMNNKIKEASTLSSEWKKKVQRWFFFVCKKTIIVGRHIIRVFKQIAFVYHNVQRERDIDTKKRTSRMIIILK